MDSQGGVLRFAAYSTRDLGVANPLKAWITHAVPKHSSLYTRFPQALPWGETSSLTAWQLRSCYEESGPGDDRFQRDRVASPSHCLCGA